MIKYLLFLAFFLFTLNVPATLNEVDKAQAKVSNILPNPGYELGKANITATDLTDISIVTSGSNKLKGYASATWNGDASSQQLTQCTTVPNGYAGQNGAASYTIMVPSGTATHTIAVNDGASTFVSATITSSTYPTPNTVNFIYPAGGTSICLTLTTVASDEPLIAIDSGFLGLAKDYNIGEVSQAIFIGSGYFATTASCIFTRTNTALGALSDTDCPGATIELNPGPGTIQTTDYNAPKFAVTNLPPGYYEVGFSGEAVLATSAQYSAMSINDGTTSSGQSGVGLSTAATSFHVVGYFSYTTAANRTFELYASSAANALNIANDANNQRVYFYIKRFPLTAEQNYTTNQSDFSWVDCGATSVGATTTPPTKATGISIDKQWCKRVGDTLHVRIEYKQTNSTSSAAGTGDYLWLVPLSLTADTTKITAYATVEGWNSSYVPTNSIGFVHAGTGSAQASGSVVLYDSTRVRFFADDGASNQQGAVGSAGFGLSNAGTFYTAQYEIPVTEWQTTNRAPQLVNSVVSSYNGVMKQNVANLNCDAGSAITSQLGTWVSSIGNASGGACAVTLTTGIFSAAPYCFATPNAAFASVGLILSAASSSATAVSVDCEDDASTACTAYDFNLFCVGVP